MFFRMTILIIENTNLVRVFKRFNYFFVIHAGFEGHIAEKERKQGSFKIKNENKCFCNGHCVYLYNLH